VKKSPWVPLVIICVLLLTACGQAAQPTTGPETPSGEVFMIALPRIVVDVDSEGVPSILGIKPSDIGMSIQFPKQYVDLLTAGNVQHIEIRLVGHGVVLLANAKPLPHLKWSDESLADAVDLAAVFNVPNTALLKKLVPIVRRLGLDIVLRFPRAAGVQEIPFADPAEVIKIAPQPTTEGPSVIAKFEIRYDERGVPGILGLTAEDLAALGIRAPGVLDPAMIKAFQAGNVQHIELRTRTDGLYIYVNDKVLPNLVWDSTFLANAVELYAQLYPTAPYTELVKTVLPGLDRADIDVLIHFPLAAGAEPIPAQFHP
jgi:hypothetical protein